MLRVFGASCVIRRRLSLRNPVKVGCAQSGRQCPRLKSTTAQGDGVLYEGPFAKITLRLKRVSLASSCFSIIGIPMVVALHNGDVPLMGQLAVGFTAVLGSTGTTVAFAFCFDPYVHTLERIPVRKCHAVDETTEQLDKKASQQHLVKATTRNILAMRVETVFDPTTEPIPYSGGIRPFCNFMAKGRPLYVHPELIIDKDLLVQLIGKDAQDKELMKSQHKPRKEDEDELF